MHFMRVHLAHVIKIIRNKDLGSMHLKNLNATTTTVCRGHSKLATEKLALLYKYYSQRTLCA